MGEETHEDITPAPVIVNTTVSSGTIESFHLSEDEHEKSDDPSESCKNGGSLKKSEF